MQPDYENLINSVIAVLGLAPDIYPEIQASVGTYARQDIRVAQLRRYE